MKTVIIGAGWSGLAAATFLQERGQHVRVLEASPRPGGRIKTHREDGYLVEAGPHGVIPSSPATRALLDASKVTLVTAPPNAPRFVVHKNRAQALPSKPPEIITTPLLSATAKARLLTEPFHKPGSKDETVGAFARRRFGNGVSHLVDAFVTGVYAGDPNRIVLQHAFPDLHRMDQQGGILRNLTKPAGPRPTLTSAQNGMQAIIESLAARVPITYDEPAVKLQETTDAVEIDTRSGETIRADHVVLAIDPTVTRRLLDIGHDAPTMASVHVVAFGLPAANAPREGYGLLAPEAEGRFILGGLYESALFPGRAPEGQALIRCLVGGRRHPERANLPHDEIARQAWRDLTELGIVQGEPLRTFHLHTEGIPQPEAGQGAWLDALPQNGRIHVLGIGHRAVGLNALADEAHALATRLA